MAAIYLLLDPRTAEVRYVGWAKRRLQSRLWGHLNEAKHGVETHKCRWIRALMRGDLKPLILPLEETADPLARERYWIAHYRAAGCKLTNGTDGGEGVLGAKRSDETRAKQRDYWTPERRAERARVTRGRKHSEETCAKIGAAHKGRHHAPLSAEHKARIAEAGRNRVWSDESRRKLSQAKKGWQPPPMSEERREQIRQASTGRRHTEAAKEKVRAAKLGQKRGELSPEWRAKIGAAHKGRPKSAATLVKLAAVNKARCKISDDDVRAIRALRAAGAEVKDLAARFSASKTTIWGIVKGERRRDVI